MMAYVGDPARPQADDWVREPWHLECHMFGFIPCDRLPAWDRDLTDRENYRLAVWGYFREGM